MGHKSNPIGLRLQINRTWDSRWYAEGRDYAKLLKEDLEIRKFVIDSLPQAAISKVVIERPAKLCRISIYAARPGVIIGKKGADIEKLRKKLSQMTASEVHINIVEVRKPEIDANIVAQSIAQQLERRVAFRRAMKRAVQSAMRLGAQGIRINVGGRLQDPGVREPRQLPQVQHQSQRRRPELRQVLRHLVAETAQCRRHDVGCGHQELELGYRHCDGGGGGQDLLCVEAVHPRHRPVVEHGRRQPPAERRRGVSQRAV